MGCITALVTGTVAAGLVGVTTPASAQSPDEAATAAATKYARTIGLGSGTLRLDRRVAVPGGSAVHFQQYLAGKPVIGAEVVVQLDTQGATHGATGAVSPAAKKTVAPQRSAAVAESKAYSSLAGRKASTLAKASRTTTRLAWYDEDLLAGQPSTGSLRLVHDVTVTPTSFAADGGRVLVDASSGSAVLTLSSKHEATNRRICDARNTPVADSAYCTNPVRVEGQAASGTKDVDDAYTRFGTASSFYSTTFGYDLTTKIGNAVSPAALRAIVRACISGEACPGSENAFWNGYGMVFGESFASADDVISHELTHGVTEHTSNLVYRNEPGAINESMSDVFGEFEDLANGSGNDSSTVRWKLGEDLPIGAIRDMRTPGSYGQPDTYKGSRWTTDPYNQDNGGVHTNSGVGNKAAFLITDGQTFNGQTITGIGVTKARQLYWRVENSLTSSATYAQLGSTLKSACSALASSGSFGFTTTDCQQVSKAVTATKM